MIEKLKSVKVNVNGKDIEFKFVPRFCNDDVECSDICPYKDICINLKDPRDPNNPNVNFIDFCNSVKEMKADRSETDSSDSGIQSPSCFMPVEGSLEKVYRDLGGDNDMIRQAIKKNDSYPLSVYIEKVCKNFCIDYTDDRSNCSSCNQSCLLRDLFGLNN